MHLNVVHNGLLTLTAHQVAQVQLLPVVSWKRRILITSSLTGGNVALPYLSAVLEQGLSGGPERKKRSTVALRPLCNSVARVECVFFAPSISSRPLRIATS